MEMRFKNMKLVNDFNKCCKPRVSINKIDTSQLNKNKYM